MALHLVKRLRIFLCIFLMGVYDVADCTAGALWLCTQGLADRQRLFIAGDSSGGYTTLASLAFHPDVFAAGAALIFLEQQ